MRALVITRDGHPEAEGVQFADGQVVIRSALLRYRQNVTMYSTFADVLWAFRGRDIRFVEIELSEPVSVP